MEDEVRRGKCPFDRALGEWGIDVLAYDAGLWEGVSSQSAD